MADFDFIETPENVELQQRLAGIGSRFIAGLLDTLLIAGAALVIVLIASLTSAVGATTWRGWLEGDTYALVILAVAMFLLYWGYFFFFELVLNGQSPGKRHMKLRVVREGGGAITFTDAAIRNLLRPVDGLPFYPVAGIVMFFTRKTQRLGDLAAGTVVISEAPRDYSASSDRPRRVDWEKDVEPPAAHHTPLTADEYRLLASYRLRRQELTLEARERILARLLPPILARVGRSLPDPRVEWLEAEVDHLLGGAPSPEADRGDPGPPEAPP